MALPEKTRDVAFPAAIPVSSLSQLPPLIGRDDERRDLSAFVSDAPVGLQARLIDGPPGAGKTALVEFALEEARRAGMTLLRATPAAAESALPYAALGDLFREIPAELQRALPAPQQRALSAALLDEIGDGADWPVDGHHAVARAVLSVFRGLALTQSVLVAIDDLQWMDAPSSRSLLFVLRRVSDTPLRLLIARRPGEADEWREALRGLVPEQPAWRIPLGPLSVDEIAALLATRLGLNLPRPRLVALHRRCEGNPLFALELGRALRERIERSEGDHQARDDLGGLLGARVRALSDGARQAVLAASLASKPTPPMLAFLTGGTAVEEAVAAEVLRRDDDRIRLAHPLFASVAESLASPSQLRRIHAALGELVDDEEEAALHKAKGAIEASAVTADELEAAAQRAARRGAPEMAAELAEHAARLTPREDEAGRRRRVLAQADHLLAAGDPQRARSLLEEESGRIGPGPARADVLWRLADAVGDDLPLSTRLAEQALSEAGDDDAELKTSIRLALGVFTWLSGELWASAEHVREAARLAEKSGNRQLVATALGEVMHAEAVLGVSSDPAIVERALALEQEIEAFPAGMRPSFQQAVVYVYTDRLDEARPLLEAELRRMEASGDESARVAVLFRMSELELRAGNWGKAMRLADECTALASQAGIEQEQCVALNAAAAVAAHLGRTAEATSSARRALATAVANGDEMSLLRARGTLGFIALSTRDMSAADEWLSPALADMRRLDIGELSIYNVVQNQLDVLVDLGRFEEAADLVGLIERKAAPQQRSWHLAVAARGRAVLAAGRGDLDAAVHEAALAVGEHRRLPQPFELGRTLLAKGMIERRAGRRATARSTLTDALEIFDTLGAALWAETAAGQLARISGRAPAAGSLTATEQRVVKLVAEGLSNGEIAGRLFVTVRTVEAHLSRTYVKLGVRSRVELVRWANARGAGDS